MALKTNENGDRFLRDGGEMGALMRAFDWAATPLGSPAAWPQSLRTTVSNLLHARFPQFLWWGEDLIQFYNDAYRPSLGNDGKHPAALGQKGADCWQEIWPMIYPLIQQVKETGEATWMEDQLIPIERNGRLEDVYWTFSYSAVMDDNDEWGGILLTCVETTDKVAGVARLQQSKRQLQESEARFQNLIRDANVGLIVLNGDDMRIRIVNDAWCKLIGHRVEDVLDRPLFEVIPDAEAYYRPLLQKVKDTGEPFTQREAPYKVTGSNGETIEGFIDFTYQPYREADGTITGVMDIVTDVTDQVLARKALEETTAQLRTMIDSAPFPIGVYIGREMRIRFANQSIKNVWGKGNDVEGRLYTEILPELATQAIFDQLIRVYDTGVPFHSGTRAVGIEHKGELVPYYFNYSFTPLFDAEGQVYGVMNTAADVTELETARLKTAESEAHLGLLRNTVPAMIFYLDAEQRYQSYNETFMRWFGVGATEIIGKTVQEFIGEPAYEKVLPHLIIAYSGQQERYDLYAPTRMGEPRWLNITYTPHMVDDGKVAGLIVHAADITTNKLAEMHLQESEAALRGAIELAELGTWKIDAETRKVTYSDRFQQWLGVTESTLREGRSPRVHPKDQERVGRAIAAALTQGGTGKFDEVYTIVHAVTGQERIIHGAGQTAYDVNGVPLSISGTVQDVTMQRELQLALENEVQERTEELAASNEELQATVEELNNSNAALTHSNEELAQYAYVASHDLQEPLRKIRIFTNMLNSSKTLDEGNASLAGRIGQSAERMQYLIKDLLEFSRLLKSDNLVRPVDLTEVATAVTADYELLIADKGASVTVEKLPVIQSINLQMNQLFYNLLGNALKFSKPDLPPVITIRSRAVGKEDIKKWIPKPLPFAQYHHIAVTDNGIGFETKYSEQIFEVFKRLHGRDMFPGSGIGLALCRRIAANHQGVLFAVSEVGKGSVFHIILPDKQQPSDEAPAGYNWTNN